jgi:hypothetical protein
MPWDVLKGWSDARFLLGDCALEMATSQWQAFGGLPIGQALDVAQVMDQGSVDNQRQPKILQDRPQ